MTRTPEEMEAMYQAYCLGATTAKGYKVGDLFLGAHEESKKKVGRDYQALFVEGYLNHLPRPITTDHNNIIVRIGPIEHSA
jgi:hypothetical protein